MLFTPTLPRETNVEPDGKSFLLVVFNELGEEFQAITIGRTSSGIIGRKAVNLSKISLVLFLGLDNFRFNNHCLTHSFSVKSSEREIEKTVKLGDREIEKQ